MLLNIGSHLSMYVIPLLIASAALFTYTKIDNSDSIANFDLPEKTYILNSTVYLYYHKKHKCPFLVIDNNDNHNFFSATFRTQAIDNSGSPHVLEHLTLHGSKKYPIRSVFMELMKRSFATFMNAFTSAEWTAYPFSSTNDKDFFNVLDVYLDSIFHPLLDEIDFETECHHLEFEDPLNKSTNLRHSGVVYNEMNGEYSEPDSYFSTKMREFLYPNSSSRFNFGGYPPEITNLTLNQIKQQHDKYYHPSNCLFFHYGNFDHKKVMNEVDKVISQFDKSNFNLENEFTDQPRWKEPKYIEIEGPGQEQEGKVISSVNWIVGDLRNSSEVFDLSIVSELLLGTTVSPMFKGLIETGIGESFLESGFSPYIRSPYFTIAIKGMNQSINLNETVLNILNQIYEDGFDQKRIKSIIHSQEIALRTISYGQDLWESIVSSWIHNANPLNLLDSEWEINRIKTILEIQPRYFEMILKKKIIENNHRLDFVMKPKEEFQRTIAERTKEELSQVKSQMTESQIEEIVNNTIKYQETITAPKNVKLLPMIHVQDLNKTSEHVLYEKVDNDRIYIFEQPANGLVKITLSTEIPDIDTEYDRYFFLISGFLLSLGADNLSSDDLTHEIELKTGGIDVSIQRVPKFHNSSNLHYVLNIGCLTLYDDLPETIDLLKKIILKPHFNNTEKISLFLKMMNSRIPETLLSNGHSYASVFSRSSLSNSSAMAEHTGGVSNLWWLMKLNKQNNISIISSTLQEVYNYILSNSHFKAAIHCEPKHHQTLQILTTEFLKEIDDSTNKITNSLSHKRYLRDFILSQNIYDKIVLDVDSTTYFSAVSMKGPIHPDDRSLKRKFTVKLIIKEYLIDLIREQLGAYGVMGYHSDGVTTFVSYRDTNPSKVIEAFRIGIQKCIDTVTDEMIDRTIINIISDFDTPQNPLNKGLEYFTDDNYTYEDVQHLRDLVFNMTKDDVIYEAKEMLNSQWITTIFGNSQASTIPEGFSTIKILPSN